MIAPPFLKDKTMEIKEKIKNWLAKEGLFSPDDKKAIKAAAEEAGVEVRFKSRCDSCYTDAVILLAKHYGVREVRGVVTKSGNYVFTVAGKLIWFENGIQRVLNGESDDAVIERYIKRFPNQKFFVKNEEKGGEE